jgi:hypothetical protein
MYLRRIPRPPTDWQATMIETLITLEWSALLDEATDTQQSRREAREHRRLFMRLLADFERSLRDTAAPAPPSLTDLFPAA